MGIRKSYSEEKIIEELEKIFKLNWERVFGLDFFQEEDIYGSLEKYNNLVDQVAIKYPDVRLWKCYHAG